VALGFSLSLQAALLRETPSSVSKMYSIKNHFDYETVQILFATALENHPFFAVPDF
jgi:hypothetical protein